MSPGMEFSVDFASTNENEWSSVNIWFHSLLLASATSHGKKHNKNFFADSVTSLIKVSGWQQRVGRQNNESKTQPEKEKEKEKEKKRKRKKKKKEKEMKKCRFNSTNFIKPKKKKMNHRTE